VSFHIKFQNGYLNKEFVKQNFVQRFGLSEVAEQFGWRLLKKSRNQILVVIGCN